MAGQSTNTTKVQLGEPKSFIEVAYRNTGDSLITGAKMTQKLLHHQSHRLVELKKKS